LAGTTEITGRVAVIRQILLLAWDVVRSPAGKCHMDAVQRACSPTVMHLNVHVTVNCMSDGLRG